MWICKRCGEPHQDQFKECWKCVGAQAEESVIAGEPPARSAPSPAERKLRPFSTFVLRGLIASVVAMILVLAFLNYGKANIDSDLSKVSLLLSLGWGAGTGFAVGLFFWVVDPYEPLPKNEADTSSSV